MILDFALPAEHEAHDPPEARGLARDGVRLLVSRRATGQVSHHGFRELPGLLLPGDLLVVNDTGTLPAQVRAGRGLAVHFSTPLPDGAWLVELRAIKDTISRPNGSGFPAQVIDLPGGAALTLEGKVTGRLWRARLSVAVVPYLLHYGIPIRYSYVSRDWPRSAYQTVFSRKPGSAEMPSASRPFTPEVVTDLVARGVQGERGDQHAAGHQVGDHVRGERPAGAGHLRAARLAGEYRLVCRPRPVAADVGVPDRDAVMQ